MEATVYYNPTCGTCREVVEKLRQRGVPLRLIEYLKTPPSESELDDVLKKMNGSPEDIIRTKEPIYAERFAGKTFNRVEWLKILNEHPVLIQRPIVVMGDRAAVVRPPEKLDELFPEA